MHGKGQDKGWEKGHEGKGWGAQTHLEVIRTVYVTLRKDFSGGWWVGGWLKSNIMSLPAL